MGDWLHCNKCFIKFQPNVKLCLVECGHIFCEQCIKAVENSKCLVCGKSNSFIFIEKNMHSTAQQFFVPLETQFKKLIEVVNFQAMHKRLRDQHLEQKYQFLKREAYNYHQKVKGFVSENKRLVSENKMMRAMLMNNRNNYPGGFVASTPSMTTDEMSQGDNRSEISSIPFTPQLPNKHVPGYAHRIPQGQQYDGNPVNMRNSMQIPHDLSQLYNGASGSAYFRPSPGMMGAPNNRKFNMAFVHKPPTTANSMSHLQGKRT